VLLKNIINLIYCASGGFYYRNMALLICMLSNVDEHKDLKHVASCCVLIETYLNSTERVVVFVV
jgi:hypothetical protein